MPAIILDEKGFAKRWKLLKDSGGYSSDLSFAEHLLEQEESYQKLANTSVVESFVKIEEESCINDICEPNFLNADIENFSANAPIYDIIKEEPIDEADSQSESAVFKWNSGVKLNVIDTAKRVIISNMRKRISTKIVAEVSDRSDAITGLLDLSEIGGRRKCDLCKRTFKNQEELIGHKVVGCRGRKKSMSGKKKSEAERKLKLKPIRNELPEPVTCTDRPSTNGRLKVEKPNRKPRKSKRMCDIKRATQSDEEMDPLAIDERRRPRRQDAVKWCEICRKDVGYNYEAHVRRIHGHSKYKCKICGSRFTHESNLYKHQRVPEGMTLQPGVRYCQGKDKPGFPKQDGSVEDVVVNGVESETSAEGDEPIANWCGICKKELSVRYRLTTHMKKVHGMRKWTCDICQKQFTAKYTLKHHKMTLHMGNYQKTRFPCDQCNKVYSTRTLLKQHQNIHTGNLIICDLCGDGFTNKSSLEHHRLKHTGERPFGCKECGKTFTTQGGLSDHAKRHRGEAVRRKLPCEFCGKEFVATRLREHLNSHTGNKPYECKVCGKRFGKSVNLKNHSVVHTGLRPFKCKLCSKTFTASGSLFTHMKVHKSEAALKAKAIEANDCTETGIQAADGQSKCQREEAEAARVGIDREMSILYSLTSSNILY